MADISLHARAEQVAITLQLEDTSRLRMCCVRVNADWRGGEPSELRVGDNIKVALECWEGGSVLTSVCMHEPEHNSEGQQLWTLRCLLQDTKDQGSSREMERVAVSFEWGPDQAWITNCTRGNVFMPT